MSTDAANPVGSAVPEASPDSLLADLAVILSGDKAAYLRLGPDGAVLSVKSPEIFAFGESVDGNWVRMTPEARAQAVLGCIRRAAAYCRKPRINQGIPHPSVA